MSTNKTDRDGFVTVQELGNELKKIPGMAEKIEYYRKPAWQRALSGVGVLALAIPVIIAIIAMLQAFGLLAR